MIFISRSETTSGDGVGFHNVDCKQSKEIQSNKLNAKVRSEKA